MARLDPDSLHTRQVIDPLGRPLRMIAYLLYGPVAGVALGDVLGPGTIDQALGHRTHQHQLPIDDAGGVGISALGRTCEHMRIRARTLDTSGGATS